MFGHIVFGVSDYAQSKDFFLKALAPLGVALLSDGRNIEAVCHAAEDA